MNEYAINIVDFDDASHRHQVVSLWQTVFGYEAAHNSPELVIENKIQHGDGLFFVAETDRRVIGTVMAGYDGHRGWIYSISVHPDYQHHGIGSRLLASALEKLDSLGCLKVNLQILAENEAVIKFYQANGFEIEPRISMGKKLY